MKYVEGAANRDANVNLENIFKSYEGVHAVQDVSLEIEAGSFFSLLGPSGCGKSTTLRIVAGLEMPDSGTVRIGGHDVTNTPPQKRPTAMVFQNYALFPHMSVSENVGYGLAARKVKATQRRERVISALKRVGLAGLLDKSVTELSGGQQQRVALARAMATEPDVLLFDEPLSNLDVELREQTRFELKRMQTDSGVTSIYVTHDQEEALSLSDMMAIMKDGRIVQVGRPRDMYAHPETAFVARFLGGSNIIEHSHAELITEEKARSGEVLAIRPEDIVLRHGGPFEATLLDQQFLGRTSELWLKWKGVSLRVFGNSARITQSEVRFEVVASLWVRDDR